MLEGLLDLCLPIFQSFGLMISFQSRMRFCRAWLVCEGLQTVHMSCPVRLFLVHEKKSDQGESERQNGGCMHDARDRGATVRLFTSLSLFCSLLCGPVLLRRRAQAIKGRDGCPAGCWPFKSASQREQTGVPRRSRRGE